MEKNIINLVDRRKSIGFNNEENGVIELEKNEITIDDLGDIILAFSMLGEIETIIRLLPKAKWLSAINNVYK